MNLSVFTRVLIILSSIMAGLLCFSEKGLAYQPGALVSPQPIPNFAGITSGHWGTNYPKFEVSGALVSGDGGYGIFTYSATSCTADNGGTCLHDADGHSYTRDNVTGDIRQFGVTAGSAYDCSTTTGTGPAGCSAADTLMASLLSAANTKRIPLIQTGGIIIRLASTLTLPANVTLDCNRIWFGNNNATGNMSNLPGTIYLDHGASLAHAPGSGYKRCAAVSTAYALVAPFTTIRGEIDFWGQGGLVQTNGDTAFVCGITSCTDIDVSASGFDTCFQNSNSGAALFDNPEGDCNVGLAAFENNGKRTYRNVNIFPFTTRGLKNIVDGTGANTWNDSNSEWWTITGVVDDGTGQCAIQSTEHSLVDLHTGDIVDITTLPIRESCQGHWTITKSGSNIILNGSSYTGPTTTGSFQSGHNVITNIANDANVYPGQTINGVAGIPNGTQILHIDHVSHFAAIDTNATADGSSLSIFFANSTGSLHMTTCNPPKGGCIQLSAAQRQIAGGSAGGQHSGGLATGIMLGGPGDDDKDAGAIIDVAQVLGHQVQLHVQTALHPSIHQLSGDTDSNHTLDPTQIGVWIDGVNEGVDISGRAIGRAGIALLVTDAAAAKSCTLYKNLGATAGSPDFQAIQVDDGCLDLAGSHATAGDVMIGHLAGPVFMEGGNSFPNATIFTENDAARSLIMGGANVFDSGYAPVFNNNTDSAKAGTTGSITAGSGQITGATFDTTGLVVGMTIVPPNKADLREKTEIETLTTAPCIPSCAVTMTSPAKLTDTGTFLFKGLLPALPQISGMQRRLIGHDSINAFDEIDAYGGTPGTIGVRANGTLGQPTAVQTDNTLYHTGGRGYGATGISSASRASLDEKAAENWTDTAQGAYFSFNCTVPGGLVTAECARLTGTSFTLSGTTKLFFIPTGGTTQTSLNDFGARVLSVSDFGAVGDGSTDDSAAFSAAFTAAAANNINTVYVTKNLKYYLASGLSVPTGYKLQCLNAYAGQLTNGATTPTGDHKNYPYTLLIPSASTVTLSNGGPNGEIDGCTIENKAVYDTPNPTDWPSWRVTAAAFGGTGVTAGGDGAAIRNSLIVGFNQCYLASGYDTTQVVNVIGDCTASFKLVNSQFFSGQWTNVHADPVLSDRTTWNQITLAIATIADSASTPGIYRVTLASPCSVANCPRTGDPAYVGLNNSSTGLPTGAESAAGGNGAGDGSWTITKIDNSNYDLVGSKSTATITTGTTVIGSNQVCGVGDLVSNNVASHIRAPQAVTGTGIPGGTTLVTLDPYMGCVWLSAAATASGAIANLTFTDNAYMAGANPYYLRLFASVRTGAGFEINNTLDGKFFGLHAYDHRTAMLWNNTSRSNTFHGFVDEYENLLMDPLSIGLDIEDATGGNSMDGGAIGQSSGIGTAVLNRQTVTSAKAANKITNVNIGGTDFVGTAGEPAYLYNESGNLTLVAADAGPGDNGNMFVADNIRFFNAVVGDNNLTVPYFQSETAAGRSCILGGSLAVGTYASLCPQTVTQTITANVGGGQAGATQLTSVINSVVNCASDHCGVALPPAVAGSVIYVINRSSKILDVYANYGTSDIINGGATTDVVSLPARTIIGTIPSIAAFMVTTNANWRTTPSYNGATLNGTLCQFSVACVFGQGPVYNATGTLQTGYHSVVGTYTLVAGTVTITLTGSAIFGGTTNYQCFANDNGAAVAATSTQNVSASSFKVFGTLTDTGTYFCTGN